MKRWPIVVSLLIALLLITGCTFVEGGGTAEPGKLEIIDKDLIKDDGGTRVVVTVKNVGSNRIELAEVTVKFYDKDKTLIETGKDAIINLNAAESWTFTIECKGAGCDRIESYQIDAIAGTSGEREW